tara:strand:- start:7717 stop:9438 length:1722 start_codon:yes stop_codon:yes gene_type:complete
MNRKSIVVSYISENPSLISEPIKLARLIISETDGEYSLKELIKEIKETVSELLSDDGDKDGYNTVIISHKTIRTKVDNEFDGNPSAAARAMGLPERTVRRWYNQPNKKTKDVRGYVVTYAQNDTPVHLGFYKSLLKYCKQHNYELIVYKGKYRNPTSIIESKKEDVSWDDKVKPYLLDSRRSLNSKIGIYPAMTNPTAVRPLSGFDVHTGDKSGIFPHPKYQLKTIATPSKSMPKILTTTGAITVPNYSKSKAGEKAKIHHIIGAVVVEIVDEKRFHMRQLSADKDGSFFDIAGGAVAKYSPSGITGNHGLETLVLGDLHHPFIDKNALKASMDQIERFKPKNLFLHDVLDCWAVNHHSRSDRFLNTAKLNHGVMDIEKEVDGSVDLIATLAASMKGRVHIVPSNHDDALDRWLHDEKLDNLGVNSAYFHYLSYNKHLSARPVITGFSFIDAYQFSAREKLDAKYDKSITSRVSFIKRDTPVMIKDVDFSMHGDQGSSGARGSALGLSKIGVKSVIGHSHSCQVIDGCYQVGVNALIPLGYAKGANSWTFTNCFQYSNGKRTLITSIDGKYYL